MIVTKGNDIALNLSIKYLFLTYIGTTAEIRNNAICIISVKKTRMDCDRFFNYCVDKSENKPIQ